MLDDRLTFRLTPTDLRHFAVIEDHLRGHLITPSRTQVIRDALRAHAGAITPAATTTATTGAARHGA